MTGRHRYPRNGTPIVGGHRRVRACHWATAQGYNLLDKTAWVALVILRPVIMVAAWQAESACLCKDSRFFAAFAANSGVHLAVDSRHSCQGTAGRPTYAVLWFANP